MSKFEGLTIEHLHRGGLYGLYSSADRAKPPLPITVDEAAYIEAADNDDELARRILEVSRRPLNLKKYLDITLPPQSSFIKSLRGL